MIVDCKTCPAHANRCDDCVVTVLRGPGSAEHPIAPGLPPSDEFRSTGGLGLSDELRLPDELQLDAAERGVLSMFVGAGLVNAGAAARTRARREIPQPWTGVRDAG